ncbi:MAG TPA: DUF2652 domain-containing protein [Xanthomonadaceae bacterium]|jgi:hypothetical protein|nr:DUF2652 domain-containing protein [Xanthomonadaceae bacterium]
MIRLTHVQLVIVDISGYTDFIVNRTISLVHAEEIISELLNAIAERSQHPLTLNKFEGDAALLFAESGDDPAAAATDVIEQLGSMFDAFTASRERIRQARTGCSCDACTNVMNLCLKAFVHCGEIAIKQLRGFTELAGEDVILLHRLLKNNVDSREYVIVTDAVCTLWPTANELGRAANVVCDGVGTVATRVLSPDHLPRLSAA